MQEPASSDVQCQTWSGLSPHLTPTLRPDGSQTGPGVNLVAGGSWAVASISTSSADSCTRRRSSRGQPEAATGDIEQCCLACPTSQRWSLVQRNCTGCWGAAGSLSTGMWSRRTARVCGQSFLTVDGAAWEQQSVRTVMKIISALGVVMALVALSLVAFFPLQTISLQRTFDRLSSPASSPANRPLAVANRHLLVEHQGVPNVLIAYASTSLHTATLAEAISQGLIAAGSPPSAVKVMSVLRCDVRLHVLGWADVILIGGPVERGNMTASMARFVSTLSRVAGDHAFLQGKLAAAFATAGAISARAEGIIHDANQQLQAAGFSVPTFKDSWHYSTGLVAVTGEDPYCHVGQTDRFPHETGSKAMMSGCQVTADSPKGTLHPAFMKLSQEYSQRLYRHASLHLQHRRTWLSENDDRLQIASSHISAQNDTQLEVDIDWGEWGDAPNSPKLPEAPSGIAEHVMGHGREQSVQQPQDTDTVGDLLAGAVMTNKPYFAALLCAGMLLGAVVWTWLGRSSSGPGPVPILWQRLFGVRSPPAGGHYRCDPTGCNGGRLSLEA